MRRPLARRLFAAVLATAVPLIVIGVILFAFWFGQRRSLVLIGNVQQARLGAAFVSGWVDGNLRTLITLAASAEIQSGNLIAIRGLIDRQVHAQPTWEDLFVTDAQGRIIASHIHSGISVGDRAYFRTAKQTGKPAVSNLLISRLTGHPIINIAVPYTKNGVFSGVVVASILPRQLQQVFTSALTSSEGIIALWGSDRRLIARNGNGAVQIGALASGEGISAVFSGNSGNAVVVDQFSGQRILIAYLPIPGTPWVIESGESYQLALFPVYRAVTTFAIISLAVLLGMLTWSLRATQRIAAELDKIAAVSQEIGSGNLSARVTLNPQSDLAAMGMAINRMAERLEVSERLKFDLITLVSHELKTPLTAIITALDLMAVTPNNEEVLTIAKHQAEHLREMIDNLISVARQQAGTLVARPRSISLRPLVDALIEHMNLEHDRRKVPFINDVPADLRVFADAQLTTLALHNLLENARKYTENGKITISARKTDHRVVVTVTDTGVGFTADTAQKFFQPFMQHEPLLTRRSEGVGLGLAVVQAVIEVQGGSVFAESPGPGKGSTFGFTLPSANGDVD